MKTARLNGRPVAADLAFHRGLAYGDGVFRTCLIYKRQVIDMTEQLSLAIRDARQFGLRADRRALLREMAALTAGQHRGVLKILLLRSGNERGYRSTVTRADRLLLRSPAPRFAESAWTRGIRAARSSFRLAAQPALAGIKHLNRLEQVLASRHWRRGADEMIVCDERGRPHCGTRTNLFWVRRGVLRTPVLDRCGVAGLMRAKVLALARRSRLRVRIAAGSWRELANAEEAFVTNSLIGIWPLAQLDRTRWRAPGPVTRELMRQLDHPRLAEA
jgi:4-amino-4-deoxychorismate lyase